MNDIAQKIVPVEISCRELRCHVFVLSFPYSTTTERAVNAAFPATGDRFARWDLAVPLSVHSASECPQIAALPLKEYAQLEDLLVALTLSNHVSLDLRSILT